MVNDDSFMKQALSIKTPILLWFRNDLRLHDHEALHQAVAAQVPIIPAYIFDERQFKTIYGFPKTGGFRAKFLLESVSSLQNSLRELGSDLLVRVGKPEEVLPALAREYNCQQVFAHREITSEEIEISEKVAQKVTLKEFWGSTLTHVDDLPFEIEKLPDVFTQARKKIEKYSEVRPCFPRPNSLIKPEKPFTEMNLPTLADLGLPAPVTDDRTAFPFKGGMEAAGAHLQAYIWEKQLIATYKDTRNGLIGADYSGKFSPWLANGSISPREIYWEVKKFEQEVTSNQSTYWMIFELLWRDYFRWIAFKYGTKIFWRHGIKGYSTIPMRADKGALEQWRLGQTPMPFVNANMKELLATGFMSNRGRQNVASYLVKDLQVDWRLGAAWFESQLIDYDPCSNYGNWIYVAGVGNDPRENRYFNIEKQANVYDPEGEYRRLWGE